MSDFKKHEIKILKEYSGLVRIDELVRFFPCRNKVDIFLKIKELSLPLCEKQYDCDVDEWKRNRSMLQLNINDFLFNEKSRDYSWLVGCSRKQLKNHLEKSFYGEISWDNHGSYWHIDHIVPCYIFNLTDKIDQVVCFNYKNLQALVATENIRKGKNLFHKTQKKDDNLLLDSIKISKGNKIDKLLHYTRVQCKIMYSDWDNEHIFYAD